MVMPAHCAAQRSAMPRPGSSNALNRHTGTHSPVDGIAEELCDSFGGALQRDGVSVRGHHTALHAAPAVLKPLSVRCEVNSTCWAAILRVSRHRERTATDALRDLCKAEPLRPGMFVHPFGFEEGVVNIHVHCASSGGPDLC